MEVITFSVRCMAATFQLEDVDAESLGLVRKTLKAAK